MNEKLINFLVVTWIMSNYIGLVLHIANGRANQNGLINDHLEIFPYGDEKFGICHRTKFGGDNAISEIEQLTVDDFLFDIAKIKSDAPRQFNGATIGNKGDITNAMYEAFKYSQSLGVAVFGRNDNDILDYANPLVVLFHPKGWVPRIESEYSEAAKSTIKQFKKFQKSIYNRQWR